MTHFKYKTAKAFLLSAMSALLITGMATATEEEPSEDAAIGIGVVATEGDPLRVREWPTTDSAVVARVEKDSTVAILNGSPEGWYRVSFDGKMGYVSAAYLKVYGNYAQFESYARVNGDSTNIRTEPSAEAETVTTLDAGSIVTATSLQNGWYVVTYSKDEDENTVQGYIHSDSVDLTNSSIQSGNEVIAEAVKYLGVRYVYGGTTPRGFDCSGFTGYVYRQLGVNLPRTASGQWTSGLGTRVYNRNALQAGDLVFFNDPSISRGKAASHVGIYIGDGQFIHASSSKSGYVMFGNLSGSYYNRYYIGGIHLL